MRRGQHLIKSLRRKKTIKASEIRQSFIEFFEGYDHKHLPSSPVIPFDDPTLMFTNAGMNQFKDIFTGKKKSEYPRAVTVQKCMRAGGKHNDLENVGRTERHHTFFEMLGNFSFGDYFKEEAIVYAWEWVTKHLQLPADKIYATVYNDDDEAFGLWEKVAPELKKGGRILRFDEKENYWSMGDTGPNGPCSELHFDRGEKYGTGPNNRVNGEGDRFVEFWNLVFMQYNTKPDGATENLPSPSVDTGAGLERLACIIQNVDSNYEIDLFKDIIGAISEITSKKYYKDERGLSHRVIADHIRALTFCIADGGGLSNEKQGYVLRRILRRASRHGRKLDMQEPFMFKLVPGLIDLMGDTYPEIGAKKDHIQNVIRAEEEAFGRTLDTGLEHFDNIVKKVKSTGGNIIPGGEVFKLYDTFGFPDDLTRVMAEEQGLEVDKVGFERMMQKQKEQSRSAGQFSSKTDQLTYVIGEALEQLPLEKLETQFVRDSFETKAKVLEMFELSDGKTTLLAIIPDKTPFYVEAGGQIGDYGYIESDHFRIRVERLIKRKNIIAHVGHLIEREYGELEDLGKPDIRLRVDTDRRQDIMRNHTATHLLHASLRKVLGDHVQQSGSYVGPDKLRFDFSHFRAMTDEEIARVEKMVNEKILEGRRVSTAEDTLEDAKKGGAMAIFGEKYESKVRVVSVDDFSKELCGGTHVDNVSMIGPFMITLETAVASGVRRIEAVTGHEAVAAMLNHKHAISEISGRLNRPTEQLTDAIVESQKRLVDLEKENKKLKAERFSGGGSSTVGQETKIGDLTVRYHDFGEVDSEEMAGWVDSGKSAGEPLITLAIGQINGKRTFMSSASGKADVHIGKLAREALSELGGRGGGKPNFAQGSVPEDCNIEQVFKAFESKIN